MNVIELVWNFLRFNGKVTKVIKLSELVSI